MNRCFRPAPLVFLTVLVLLPVLPGCTNLFGERVLYQERGVRIGLERDRTTRQASPPVLNSHPAAFPVEHIRSLLGVLEVSGYTGTVAGLLVQPRPMPVFTKEELQLISGPIVEAFRAAGPRDRVFFYLPNLSAPYRRETTQGALFVRGPYLFVLLRDHSGFTKTDTGGGDDERDPRDTRGMRLIVAWPAQPASLSQEEVPDWGPYERVHTALDIEQTLYATESMSSAKPAGNPPSEASRPPAQPIVESGAASAAEDLRLQIKELTSANLDLRARLERQAQELKALQNELLRVQGELEKATKPKGRSKPGQK
jgi:hypothetical protein